MATGKLGTSTLLAEYKKHENSTGLLENAHSFESSTISYVNQASDQSKARLGESPTKVWTDAHVVSVHTEPFGKILGPS